MSFKHKEATVLVTGQPIRSSEEKSMITFRFQWSDIHNYQLYFYNYKSLGTNINPVKVSGRTFYRCCEMYYLDTSGEDLVRPFFNFLSTNYAEVVLKWKNIYAYEWVFNEFLRNCEKNNGWVLDLGAGHGFGSEVYRRIPHRKLKLISFDLSDGMLRNCPKSLERLAGKAEYLPLQDECLRGIVAVYMLHYVRTFENAFEEIARVLQPGGVFGFVVYRHDSKKDKYQRILEAKGFGITLFKTDDSNPPEYKITAIRS